LQLACEECDRVTSEAHGWIAKVAEDDDERDVHLCVVSYCPACAEREFGFISHRRPDDDFE
jgi:hypothetical protein